MKWIGVFVFLFASVRAHATQVLTAGLSLEHFDYVEESDTSDQSHERGLIPFLEIGFQSQLSCDGCGTEMSLHSTVNASTTWEGTDSTTMKSVLATDVHTMNHLEGIFTKDFGSIAIYGGLSYRIWDRFLAYGSGYREIYQWAVLPLGARADLIGARVDIAVLPMISGSLNVILSETIPSGDNTVLVLGKTVGFRLKVSRDFTFWDCIWTSVFGFESSSFGASATRTNATLGKIHEPASQTRQFGLTLSAAFLL